MDSFEKKFNLRLNILLEWNENLQEKIANKIKVETKFNSL